MTIVVVGAGRAGRRVAALARAHGARARIVPGRKLRALPAADLVVLAVADRAVAEVARRLSRSGSWEGRAVLHLSGASGPELLSPLAERGAATGVFHPMTVMAGRDRPGARAPAIFARVEGAPAARRAGRTLARWFGARLLRTRDPLGPEERARYHAACALVANDVVALLASGADLLGSLGVPRRAAEGAVVGLAGCAVAACGGGIAAGLTGPVARGDAATLARHLSSLDRASRDVHRALSLRLVEVARAAGRISAARARELRTLLAGPGSGRGV